MTATKAWFIFADDGDYRGYVVHAETRSKAKSKAVGNVAFEECEWVNLRAQRYPALDDKPITVASLIETGIDMTFEGDPIEAPLDLNCECPICEGGQP